MWLSKFLDIEEEIEELSSKLDGEIFEDIAKKKLTPLEFTVLESIFNSKKVSGYDLIQNLNKQFAGTWEAQSGTIYPLLSKLNKGGFLKSETVKSPIGPLKKVYSLTEAGEELIKSKVNTNFKHQLEFIENFVVGLASIYIQSFPEEKKEEKIKTVTTLIEEALENIKDSIPSLLREKRICPSCNAEVKRKGALFCPICGNKMT